jgi:hypothetical protein
MSKATVLHLLKSTRRRELELRLKLDERLSELAKEYEDARLARCTEIGTLASDAGVLELPDQVIGAALRFAADASQPEAIPGDAELLAELVTRYAARFPEGGARARGARPSKRATPEEPVGAAADDAAVAPGDGEDEELATQDTWRV